MENGVAKLRAQLGHVTTARDPWTVGSLLLASILLAGCNQTSSQAAQSATASAPAQTTSISTTPTSKSADVSWTPPTTNTNGSALTDLAGYRIYYGTSPDTLNQTIQVPNAGATDYMVQGLSQGTWYFAVVAYTNTGLESNLSNVASKTIS